MDLKLDVRRLALLVVLAAILGFAGGGAAWVLLKLIALITNLTLFHQWSAHTPSFAHYNPDWSLFVVAPLGGLIVSVLAKWSPVIRGHGIPEAMEAVLTRQSKVSPRAAIAKPVSAAIAIGTGAPFGAEGPIIVTGGSIGSLIGQVLPVSPSERKILLAAGAAAGMSATFGAPLAAVVLAIELLLFEFSARALIPLVVATSVAGGMHAALFGNGPLFHVAPTDFAGLRVLPSFVVMGLACGLLATIISKGLFYIEGLYRKLPVSHFWHPVIGGVLFASVGAIVPRVLGVGYDVIGDLLNARLALTTVAALAIGKLIAWWFALASGTSGGTLAPILLISAAFGTLLGDGLNHVMPGPTVTLGAFALVAMAATFGAATQATFTAVVFVFELTRDYEVVLPLMIAAVLADLVFSALNDDSLMTEKLRRNGIRTHRRFVADPFVTTRVGDIMSSTVDVLSESASLREARALFANGGHGAYPIVADDHADQLLGIISRGDVLRHEDGDDTLAIQHAARQVVTVRLDQSAQTAMHVMLTEHVDHVPVVDRDGRLAGICTRTDLMKVSRLQFEQERRQVGLWRPALVTRIRKQRA